MFVRSLRLAGFKSFADPTALEFEPGVNVIVGPNGSGKSNIADALQWVLGSQAPSSMRGASMEDVIFAGSEPRPRLGAAEVELTLDNSSGVLPLDVSEVVIARFTDRAGLSEYRINGAPCRLLDVSELLSDTGIGRSLHSVVGQGQLDAVLAARPEERRAFIEEAAQIGKYRRRRDRAVRKIERVDDNLMRLSDVLTELRRSVRPLKRQASAAQAHSELLAEHQELRQRLAATELRRLSSEETGLGGADEAQRAELLEDELAHTRARLGTAAKERETTMAAAERAAQIAHRIARAADRLASLGRLADERVERIGARLTAETEEGYRERIRLLEIEQERFGRESSELRGVAEQTERRASEAERGARELRESVAAAERALSGARARETEAAQALVRAEGLEAAGRASVGSVEARIKAVVERRQVGEGELGQDAAAVQTSEAEVRSLEERLDAATEEAAAAEDRLEKERERADRLRELLGASHAERAAARARAAAIIEVRALLMDVPDILGRTDRLLRDAEEAERLTSANEDESAEALRGAETAIEVRWSEVAERDEELRRLDALVSGAAERVSGARRRHEAREIELAALADELSRAREALADAARAAAEERAAVPARHAALEEARAARVSSERALEGIRSRSDEAQGRVNELQMERRAAEERTLAAQLRLEEAEAGIADAQRDLEGIAGRREMLRRARERASAVARTAREAATVAHEWSAGSDRRTTLAKEQARTADDQLARLRRRERELEQKLEEIGRRRNQADVRRAEIRARTGALVERAMDDWGLSPNELAERAPLTGQEEDDARVRIERLDREMRRMGPVNPRAAEEYAEAADRESFLVEQTEDLKESRRDLMKIVREVDETIVEVFGSAFESVAGEFEGVFARIFPGGAGRLTLTDPEDLLGSGIEVEARPPGKSVKKLSLLSGGERSLVALAFLFSIFRSLPSPFYLLDEVEAALDDVNLQRFLGLVGELQERAQVMIVTHQKRTMEAADVLYGVTMGKEGVSRVVAQRMDELAPVV